MSEVSSRYVIGIDLGTTNCALSYIDFRQEKPQLKMLAVEQWDTTEATGRAETLPSYYFMPSKGAWKKGQFRLSADEPDACPDYVVGRAAKDQMHEQPGRVVSSAKSWLCHGGVNRTEPILPWHSDDIIGAGRRSPVEVSSAFLAHLRKAWDHQMGDGSAESLFVNQRIVITVPASFDEVAQQLTLESAKLAGFPMKHVRLLEEPQAAFYHWLAEHEEDGSYAAALTASLPAIRERPQTVLICDVGGGTTDFSLFSMALDQAGSMHITREAVGDHLLLGGDNIDLRIAYAFEEKLTPGDRLSSSAWASLVAASRDLKEKALWSDREDELHLSVATGGGSLFSSTLSASMPAADLRDLVQNGFFPEVAATETPSSHDDGLRELGLPYAADSAITRHLAAFLAERSVDAILFTGGTMKPPRLQTAIADQIAAWQQVRPVVLQNDHMDLACALGASRYGYDVWISPQKRIQSGYARTLYVEVATSDGGHALMCLVPKGYDNHEAIVLGDLDLQVWTEQPVQFQLFAARSARQDQPGDIVSLADGVFAPTARVETQLSVDPESKKKKKPRLLRVGLEAKLTETGVLSLSCVSRDPELHQSWQLSFQVRQDEQGEPGEGRADGSPSVGVQKNVTSAITARLNAFYGKGKPGSHTFQNPKNIVREVEQETGIGRSDWNLKTLRQLWPTLHEGMTKRGRSLGHELSWLYLAGYTLRPGYGVNLDEWRVAELWRGYELGLSHTSEKQLWEQWWIMWRRVTGGLDRDAQEKLFDKIFPVLRKGGSEASPEMYMLAGSLERASMDRKVKLGNQLVSQIAGGKKDLLESKIWALARMASRMPLYGGPETIVRPAFVKTWFDSLKHLDVKTSHYRPLTQFYSQAGRLVEDREFDLSQDLRAAFVERLRLAKAPDDMVAPLEAYMPLDDAARAKLFGEALPSGLVLERRS